MKEESSKSEHPQDLTRELSAEVKDDKDNVKHKMEEELIAKIDKEQEERRNKIRGGGFAGLNKVRKIISPSSSESGHSGNESGRSGDDQKASHIQPSNKEKEKTPKSSHGSNDSVETQESASLQGTTVTSPETKSSDNDENIFLDDQLNNKEGNKTPESSYASDDDDKLQEPSLQKPTITSSELEPNNNGKESGHIQGDKERNKTPEVATHLTMMLSRKSYRQSKSLKKL